MHIHLYSIHGLFRGAELEIGRDADNGGQVVYVMELARALSRHPKIKSVSLFTRRIDDPRLSPDYAQVHEQIDEKFSLYRIQCGGNRYLPKEKLWGYLDEYVTNAAAFIKSEKLFPDWIHSHYADAAYVAMEISALLNVPFAHSSHSLGRAKLEKLLAAGHDEEELWHKFCFKRRFDAEERSLVTAEFIVTSTDQEVKDFDSYENCQRAEYHVLPPGIDFERFYPYHDDVIAEQKRTISQNQVTFNISEKLDKFLYQPSKPLILAICRPVWKKNIDGLLHAYGTDPELQAIANIAIFAGIRNDIATMPDSERSVLTELLLLMDKYNLYGKLAIPKRHDVALDVPEIYRLCARRRGVFVNVALFEPFGLTLLEASATGCPVVATQEGGPRETIPKYGGGVLVNPVDTADIQRGIKSLLLDEDLWRATSSRGITGAREHFSWARHVEKYLEIVRANLVNSKGRGIRNTENNSGLYERLKRAQSMLVCDIDGTLISETGDLRGLDLLRELLKRRGDSFVFCVASGRSLEKTQLILRAHDIPSPDVLVCGVGSFIYYGIQGAGPDRGWERYINFNWSPPDIKRRLRTIEGLELQEHENQNPYKISFYKRDPEISEAVVCDALGVRLRRQVSVIMTQNKFIDILPNRCSKGRAVRYLGHKFSIPLSQIVACGDSGNDRDMFVGTSWGIVVGNHAPELAPLRGTKRVYFAQEPSSAGIVEGLIRLQSPVLRQIFSYPLRRIAEERMGVDAVVQEA